MAISSRRPPASPPNLERQSHRPQIKILLPLHLPILAWQRKLVSMNQASQKDLLLQARHVPPDATPRTPAEGDVGRQHVPQPVFAPDCQPALGPEHLRFREHARIAMRRICRDRHLRVAGDHVTIDTGTGGWGTANEIGGNWRRKAHGLVDAGSEVVEISGR